MHRWYKGGMWTRGPVKRAGTTWRTEITFCGRTKLGVWIVRTVSLSQTQLVFPCSEHFNRIRTVDCPLSAARLMPRKHSNCSQIDVRVSRCGLIPDPLDEFGAFILF